jgi:hypothetical protein
VLLVHLELIGLLVAVVVLVDLMVHLVKVEDLEDLMLVVEMDHSLPLLVRKVMMELLILEVVVEDPREDIQQVLHMREATVVPE